MRDKMNKRRCFGRPGWLGRISSRLAVSLLTGAVLAATGAGSGAVRLVYAEEASSTGDTSAASAGESQAASDTAATVTVTFDNLRDLLTTGNVSLSRTLADRQDELDAYQEIWYTLRWEQDTMETKADDTKTDADAASLYKMNANMLKNTAGRIYLQMKNLTNSKTDYSYEKTINSYVYGAQSLLSTCLQLKSSVEAREKSLEAMESSYNATERKVLAGAATQADADEAKKQLEESRSQYLSLKEQYNQSLWKLKTMLGLQDKEIVFGDIPQPDTASIAAVDFEADKLKAMGNNQDVLSSRHENAKGTAEKNIRAQNVTIAEGNAEASITAAYENILTARTSYEAASQAYESAKLDYGALQRKKQAGLLSNTDYLQGEAAWLQKKYNMDTASLNLLQAMWDYEWEVKGVSAAR